MPFRACPRYDKGKMVLLYKYTKTDDEVANTISSSVPVFYKI